MSLLQQILDGSLVSRQRLMQARHFYSPQPTEATADQAFARWTERATAQTELASAKELAGLSDTELSALESEFVRCPIRPRTDRFQGAFRAAAVLAAVGAAGLALQAIASALGDGGYRALQVLSIVCLLMAVCTVIAGSYVSFSTLHLDMSHGTVGLYVGKLDDQHPWLYDAMAIVRNPAAEEYRRKVLSQRGPLRGADYLVMRELVRAQEAIDRTLWPRTVAERLQRQAPVADTGTSEPRLVRVGSRSELRTRDTDRASDNQAAARGL